MSGSRCLEHFVFSQNYMINVCVEPLKNEKVDDFRLKILLSICLSMIWKFQKYVKKWMYYKPSEND